MTAAEPQSRPDPVGSAASIGLDGLIASARSGRPRAVARLISLVENGSPSLRQVVAALAPSTGRAHVVGLTGAPGVGKSSTTAALVAALRGAGERVGVLAVDPSSPFTGGALLGDRVRMQHHALDGEVFIRSMAARGHLGGLAVATPQALRVYDLAGCDTALVETVGVGQSEVEIAGQADTTVVLLAPGMGDAIQAAKAGILEIGDVFVVNKSDREGAQALVRELRGMVALTDRPASAWKPPILRTVASTGDGVPELVQTIRRHREHAQRTGAWGVRRLHRARAEVETLAMATLRATLAVHGPVELDGLAEQVRDGTLDPFTAADLVIGRLAEVVEAG